MMQAPPPPPPALPAQYVVPSASQPPQPDGGLPPPPPPPPPVSGAPPPPPPALNSNQPPLPPAPGSGSKPGHSHHSSSRPHSGASRSRPEGHSDKHRSSHAADRHHHHSAAAKKAAASAPATSQPALDNRLRRETPFLASIRFKNDLPQVPGDPMLMVDQQSPEALAAFNLTALEKEPKRDLILPPDLGITISLLDVERYAVPKDKPPLHPADLALLGPDADSLLSSQGNPLAGVSKAGLGLGASSPGPGPRRGTALRSAAEVSWLMRTTYISAESETVKARAHANEYEARREKMVRASQEPEHDAEADEEAQRQAQIRIIEATFQAARNPPVHRTKPGMRALEVIEVLPDFDMWGQKYMVAHFDKDPAEEVSELQALPDNQLAYQVAGRCMLRGFKLDESRDDQAQQANARGPTHKKERFVAFLLPRDTQQAAEVMQEKGASGLDADDLEGDYSWAREYVYEEVDAQAGRSASSTAQQSYLVHFKGGRALYSQVGSQLELRKREGGVKGRPGTQLSRPSQVTLRKRAMTQQELDAANKRRNVLHPGSGHYNQQAEDMEEEEEYGYEGGEEM